MTCLPSKRICGIACATGGCTAGGSVALDVRGAGATTTAGSGEVLLPGGGRAASTARARAMNAAIASFDSGYPASPSTASISAAITFALW